VLRRTTADLRWFLLALLCLITANALSVSRSGHWTSPPLPQGDGPDYESIAYSIANAQGFQFAWSEPSWQAPYRESSLANEYTQFDRTDWPGPTASRPPLLPTLIAGLYQVLPRGPIAFATLRALSVLALSLAGAIAVLTARTWTKQLILPNSFPARYAPDLAACLTLLVAIADRTIKRYNSDFLTEPYAALGISLFLLLLLKTNLSTPSIKWFALVGVWLAMLVLLRSMLIFWLPLFLLAATFGTRSTNNKGPLHWKPPIILLATFLLCLAPWWIRNCAVLNAWMPLGGQGAASLRGGYCDEALLDGGNWNPAPEQSIHQRLDQLPESKSWSATQREVALAKIATQETFEWARTNWKSLPYLALQRLTNHYGPFRIDHLIWKISALVGFLFLIGSQPNQAKWIAAILLSDALSIALLYETGGRFLIPIHPLLYALFAYGAVRLALICIPNKQQSL